MKLFLVQILKIEGIMITKVCLMILGMILSISVFAETCPEDQDFCEIYGTEISAVYANKDGFANIKVPSVSGWLYLGNMNDNDGVKGMYSTAMAAQLASKNNVWVRWDKSTKKVVVVTIGY